MIVVGSRVEAKRYATKMGPFGTKWLPGVIEAIRKVQVDAKASKLKYDIQYDDGKKEADVLEQFVKLLKTLISRLLWE